MSTLSTDVGFIWIQVKDLKEEVQQKDEQKEELVRREAAAAQQVHSRRARHGFYIQRLPCTCNTSAETEPDFHGLLVLPLCITKFFTCLHLLSLQRVQLEHQVTSIVGQQFIKVAYFTASPFACVVFHRTIA